MNKKHVAAIVGFLVVVLAYFGYEVSPDVQDAINTIIVDIGNVLTGSDSYSDGL